MSVWLAGSVWSLEIFMKRVEFSFRASAIIILETLIREDTNFFINIRNKFLLLIMKLIFYFCLNFNRENNIHVSLIFK